MDSIGIHFSKYLTVMVVVLGLHIPTTTFASENLTELKEENEKLKIKVELLIEKFVTQEKQLQKLTTFQDESLLLKQKLRRVTDELNSLKGAFKKVSERLDVEVAKTETLLLENKNLSDLRDALEVEIAELKSPKEDRKSTASSEVIWEAFDDVLPIQQIQFCKLTGDFFRQLDQAKTTNNEIKVNMVFKQRQEDLDALIPNGGFEDWIFNVLKVEQVEDGSAAIVMQLPCETMVGSGVFEEGGFFGGKKWRATIPYGDRRYRELAKLDARQFVTASGEFLEVKKFKPDQPETFYASVPLGEHPLVKEMNLDGELFIADFSYIAALSKQSN